LSGSLFLTAGRGRKLIGRKPVNLIVGWCGRFLFFVVPPSVSQVVGQWPENQILIPDRTDFHCPGTTLIPYQGRGIKEFYISILSEK